MTEKQTLPIITKNNTIDEAIQTLDETNQGVLLLVDSNGCYISTIKDRDVRKIAKSYKKIEAFLEKNLDITTHTACKATSPRSLLALMNKHHVDHITILNEKKEPIEIVNRSNINSPILLSTPHLGSKEIAFVNEAFETNWIAPVGPHIDAFEEEISTYCGVKAACAVNSGTAAIHLGLRLLNVSEGDIVFVSDLTFIASVSPILYQQATPVFIDSEPFSWNMSPKALAHAFKEAKDNNKLPKAVIVVSLYGQSADMDPILEICNYYNVPILEDAAESLGAKYKNKASGTFGKIGVYSFNGNKIITTSGGGMLVSDDVSLMKRAKKLSTQAREPTKHYEHTEIGYNYRMSNILAGVGRGQLKVLNKRVCQRRRINEIYYKHLKEVNNLHFMPEPEWSYSNRWLSCVSFESKSKKNIPDELTELMDKHLIEIRPLWKPMHMQPVFTRFSFYTHDNESPVSKKIFKSGICLPSGSNMTTDEVLRVIDVLKKAIKILGLN